MTFFFFAITQGIITPYWTGDNVGSFIKLLLGIFTIFSAVRYWKDEGELMKEQYGTK